MILLTNPQEQTRFLRFLAVGVTGAVVDFGTFNLLTLLLHVPAVLASMISLPVDPIHAGQPGRSGHPHASFCRPRSTTAPDIRLNRASFLHLARLLGA